MFIANIDYVRTFTADAVSTSDPFADGTCAYSCADARTDPSTNAHPDGCCHWGSSLAEYPW